MPLSRFMRENSRKLVLIIMSALLVIFLIEPVLMYRRQRAGADIHSVPVGTAFGGTVTTTDLARTQDLVELLNSMGLPPPRIAAKDQTDESISRHLVFEEARRSGLHVGHDQVLSLIKLAGVKDAHLSEISRHRGRSLTSIYDAVAEWLAVQQLASLQIESIVPSDPRIEVKYRDEAQSVKVDVAVIDSKAFLGQIPDPTDDELKAFFEETRDRLTTHTEETLQYGYLLQNRVDLEFLTVSPSDVRDKIEISTREARRFYDDNLKNYARDDRPPGPTTQPSDFTPQKVQLTFDEARDRVREDLRTQKAIEESMRVVNEMREELARPWVGAKRGDDGYLEPPPPDRIVAFEMLKEKYGVKYPVIHRKSGLLDQVALGAVDRAFSAAQFTVGTDKLRATELAMRVKGLATAEPKSELPYLTPMEPSPVVVYSEFNASTRQLAPRQAFVFRVTQVAPSAPPASIDEVRDRLRFDLKNKKAYEQAEAYARRLFESAQQSGLAAAVESDTALKDLLTKAEDAEQKSPDAPRPNYAAKLGPKPTQRPVNRSSAYVENVGMSKKLAQEVFKLLDTPPTANSPARRVVLSPMANRGIWLVAEVGDVAPMYAGELANRRDALAQQVRTEELRSFQQLWFDPNSIRERAGFVPAAAPKDAQ
ncbi:MAG: hypothetical protein U1D55_10205 [Phycisphaerae bacterium]